MKNPHVILIVSSLVFLGSCLGLTPDEISMFKSRTYINKNTGIQGEVSIQTNDMYTLFIKTNNIPDHATGNFNGDRGSENFISKKDSIYLILKEPIIAEEPGCLPMGPIGIALNGVSIHNPYTKTCCDAGLSELNLFDECWGHPSPSDNYHYHTAPLCLMKTYCNTPSGIIGVAFDGFPIYGPFDEDGNEMTSADLDECNGKFTRSGEYRYHVTGDFPYFLKCFKGEVISQPEINENCGGCNEPQIPCNDHDHDHGTETGLQLNKTSAFEHLGLQKDGHFYCCQPEDESCPYITNVNTAIETLDDLVPDNENNDNNNNNVNNNNKAILTGILAMHLLNKGDEDSDTADSEPTSNTTVKPPDTTTTKPLTPPKPTFNNFFDNFRRNLQNLFRWGSRPQVNTNVGSQVTPNKQGKSPKPQQQGTNSKPKQQKQVVNSVKQLGNNIQTAVNEGTAVGSAIKQLNELYTFRKNNPPQINNQNSRPQGSNLSKPPQGNTLNKSPKGGNLNNPPKGNDLSKPSPGNNLNSRPHGSNLNKPPQGNNLNKPPQGNTLNEPPQGNDANLIFGNTKGFKPTNNNLGINGNKGQRPYFFRGQNRGSQNQNLNNPNLQNNRNQNPPSLSFGLFRQQGQKPGFRGGTRQGNNPGFQGSFQIKGDNTGSANNMFQNLRQPNLLQKGFKPRPQGSFQIKGDTTGSANNMFQNLRQPNLLQKGFKPRPQGSFQIKGDNSGPANNMFQNLRQPNLLQKGFKPRPPGSFSGLFQGQGPNPKPSGSSGSLRVPNFHKQTNMFSGSSQPNRNTFSRLTKTRPQGMFSGISNGQKPLFGSSSSPSNNRKPFNNRFSFRKP